MIYKIRVVLDCEKDVIRDIEIDGNSSFENLHNAIFEFFNFETKEIASFYLSDDKWSQGQEIFLESFEKDQLLMRDTKLSSIINNFQKKFLYVFDFLELWTFFIEVVEIDHKSTDLSYNKLIFSYGELPKFAPKKNFIAEKTQDNNDSELNDFY